MKPRITAVLKWTLAAAFFCWSGILTVVLLGEDSPEMQMSFFRFTTIKAMALCSAYATYKAARWCYDKGLFPTLIYDLIAACEEDL